MKILSAYSALFRVFCIFIKRVYFSSQIIKQILKSYKNKMKNSHFLLPDWRFLMIFAILAGVVGGACWKIGTLPPRMTLVTVTPAGIMGTTCTLTVYVQEADAEHAHQLLAEAEAELRQCEMLTSTWLEHSEISRFNRAKAGEKIAISPFTEAFFRCSREAYEQTGGVFDITCGRVWQLWKAAAEAGVMPTGAEIQAARDASRWEHIHLEDGYVTKTTDTAEVVTGGVAKGMAIDRALACLKKPGVQAAVVDVGGDVAVFRVPEMKLPVTIYIHRPQPGTQPEALPLYAPNTGVCTSGDYARYFEVAGRKFSQIIDPRTGQPAEIITAVTILAPDATTADIWATAVSILGEDALPHLPPEVKVLKMMRSQQQQP